MAMTVEQAKRWVEEAEKKSIHDISWEELTEAITVLKSIVGLQWTRGGWDTELQKPWLERALDLAHKKAVPWLQNARAGDTSQETMENLTAAARAVRASANLRGELNPVDKAFLEELGQIATRAQRAQPRRGRGPRADEIERKRRRAEGEYRRLKEAFFDTGRRAGLSEDELESEWYQIETFAPLAGESVEAAAAAKIAEWEAAILDALGDPIGPPGIGLPRGWSAVREVELHPADRARFGGAESTQVEVPARYYADDALVAPVPTEQVPELQEAFVAAGLLEEGSFWAGVWDAETIKAYTTVLGYANLWGMTWESALQRMEQAHAKLQEDRETKKTVSEIIAETYVQPDYATLAQEVKSMFRQRLRREPTEQELAELTAALGGWYRASFDVQMQVAEEAEARAESGSDEPIQAQTVDPIARLGELFDERFGAEERRFEQIDNVRENMTHMFQSLRSLQTMTGS